jgi:putative MATE family efflux protein
VSDTNSPQDPPETSSGGDSTDDDDPSDSITEGSLVRPLFNLAWPIVAIQLLQVMYNVADTLYLGRFSAEAVGALSLAFPLVFLLIAVAGGFTTAGAILVAQYTGAEGDESAGKVVGQTVTVVSVLAAIIGIGGYFYTRPALELLPSDPETAVDVVPLAADYMEIIFLGIPFMFGFFVFSSLMRGYGDTRTPMYLMFVSVVLNIALDPIFIFGFENNPLFIWTNTTGLESTLHGMTGFTGWGIEGAAGATILSRGVAAVVGIYLLFGTGIGPAVTLGHLTPDIGFIEDLVRLGTPSMVEQSMSALAMIALTAIVVTFAPPVVAAYGLGNRIISLVFLPAMGVGRAIDTMVGQNLGADREDRATKSVYLAVSTASGVMLFVAVIAVIFAEPIVSIFIGEVDNAAETISFGVEYIRTRSVEFAFIGITQVLLGAFRGAGNTKTAMVISICTLWIGRVGTMCLLVFGLGWGASGIWVGMAMGNTLGAVIAVPWFLRGTWKEKYIDEEADSQSVGDGPSTTASDEPVETVED